MTKDPPGQIAAVLEAILIVGVGKTLTVVVKALALQPLASLPVTVYTVNTLGVKATVAVVAPVLQE